MKITASLLSICLSTWILESGECWQQQLFSQRRPTRLFVSSEASGTSNIVLRPSDDPKAFDSAIIGTTTVHRYSRADDPDETTEYIMWYHGRNKDFDESNELPPLSTGRIGRATSRNGLAWVKDTGGSLSEDVKGVSLGLNKESWWGFDTAHVGLGSVLLPMSTPAVMTEGGVYLMYYMGGSFEETDISDYVKGAKGSAPIKGMKMKIGVALSQDGVSWGRVEGDDPSGACMVPYDSNDPNLQFMAYVPDGANHLVQVEEELYCAWPSVAVDVNSKDENFAMYYSTMTKDGKEKCIAYAVSDDGFRWAKRGICLRPDESGNDAAGCARCSVQKKATFDEESGEWKEADGWVMYYEGESKEDGKHRIMVAESSDGRKWIKCGVALDVGDASEGAWDSGSVGSPSLLRMDDGSQRMYYTGRDEDKNTAVGVAKLDKGGSVTEWEREQATITFA